MESPSSMSWLVWPVLFGAFFAWRLGIIVFRLWFHPLSHVPGPFLGCVTSLYRTYWFLHGNEQEEQIRLHRKYGSIVRYAPNAVIFDDPNFLPLVFHRKADKTEFNAPNLGFVNTFFAKYHHDHVAFKKRISHAYSLPNVQKFEPEIEGRLSEIFTLLAKDTDKGRSVDILTLFNWFGFDNVCQLCFGRKLGFVENGHDAYGLIEKMAQTVWLLEFIAIQDNLSWYLRNTRLGRYFIPKPTNTWGIGAVMAERDRIINELVDHDGKLKNDIIQESFLAKWLSSPTSPLTLDEVRGEILTSMQAGSETISLMLAVVVFHVARNPQIQQQLQAELEEAERDGFIPPVGGMIRYDQATQLPYLSACIREGLRYGPGTAQIPRESPQDTGLELEGIYIPPTVSVSTSAWIAARNTRTYGADADIYRPERWLQASPELVKNWDKLDFTFGYGARRCLGKHFANMQLWKLVGELFRRYDIVPLDPDNLQQCGVSNNWNVIFHTRKRANQGTEKSS